MFLYPCACVGKKCCVALFGQSSVARLHESGVARCWTEDAAQRTEVKNNFNSNQKIRKEQ